MKELKNSKKKFNVQTVTPDQIKALTDGVKALSEMFLIVYQGSKTIPAATKEILVEKCSQGMKALNTAEIEVKTDDSQS